MSATSTSHIKPYVPNENNPWDFKQIQYVFRKIAYGASYETINAILNKQPLEWIDAEIKKTKKQKSIDPPKWVYGSLKNYKKKNGELKDGLIEEHYIDYCTHVLTGIKKNAIEGKIIMFWANHFSTSFWEYESPIMLHQYFSVLKKNALGNFKKLVKEIGLTPAMLNFLNGNENIAKKPNENFSRELLELFLLGKNNGYTQKDITELSRAFTGWKEINWNKVYFDENDFDNSQKTIFDKKDNFNYHKAIDLLFKEKKEEIADFICRKIYSNFIHNKIDDGFVKKMSVVFIENDFDLTPLFTAVYKSEKFHSNEFRGTKIKDPMELGFVLMNELNIDFGDKKEKIEFIHLCEWTGQALFNPPNVSGWQGGRNWINPTKLLRRWKMADWIIYELTKKNKREIFKGLALKISKDISDPEEITSSIISYFDIEKKQQQGNLDKQVLEFKGDWPEEVFRTGWWNLNREDTEWQVAALVAYFFHSPASQLI